MAESKHPPNIYIVGAQCTGKTTLIKALEQHFCIEDNLKFDSGHTILRPKIITEVARGVLREHDFIADDITSSPARALALQDLILKAQVRAEAAISKHDGWFISDRSGADPIVYAKKYVSDSAANDLLKSPEWLTLTKELGKSVVIVCETGAEWLKDDEVRLMPESRDAWIGFHRLFCKCLDDWGLEYDVLPSGVTELQDRAAFVLEIWGAKYRKCGGNS